MKTDDKIKIGILRQGGSNCCMRYNPKDGYIYAVLHNQNAIYRYKLKTGPDGYPIFDGDIEQFIDNGAGARDGAFNEAQFRAPRGIEIDPEGNLYIADTSNHSIRKVDLNNKVVTTIAGRNGQAGYADGDPLTEALFNQPFGVVMDKDGSLYIGDSVNRCIRKLAIE